MHNDLPEAAGRGLFVDKLLERGERGLLAMEEACFGSRDVDVIWERVCGLLKDVVDSAPISVCHYSVSIGAVLGLDLSDGRRVAVKVFPPWHDARFLAAANRVRQHLVERGYPAPCSLSTVERFGLAHAWVEEWVEAPPPAPAPDVATPLAWHLAELLQHCARTPRDPALARSWQTFERPVGIWRNPPRPDADLSVEVSGADWVREIAEFGRRIAEAAPGPPVVGHVDWRPANVRLTEDGRLAAVYDWDSIQLTRQVHVLAGACDGLRPEAVAQLLDAFEAATSSPLPPAERRAVAGRVVWSHALWARYELVRRLPEPALQYVPRLASDRDAYLAAV